MLHHCNLLVDEMNLPLNRLKKEKVLGVFLNLKANKCSAEKKTLSEPTFITKGRSGGQSNL